MRFNGPMAGVEDPVAHFRVAAERYCGLIEFGWRSLGDLLFAELARSLACLYAAATVLPIFEVESDDLPADQFSDAQWRDAFWPFAGALRRDDVYWDVEPYTEGKPELVAGLLQDDLGDIYRDIKEGLLLEEAGFPDADVVWQWRFNFWSHWGFHAASALRALHSRLADAGGPNYDPADYSPR